MSDIQKLLQEFLSDRTAQPYPIHEYAFLTPKDVPFTAEVRKACERNACGMYGTCWSCPPGAGDWEELRDHFHAYSHALVYTTKHDLEDSFDLEGMADGNKAHHQVDMALLQMLEDSQAVQALVTPEGLRPYEMAGAEGCHLCASCTYPQAPCRHPTKARRSMEACGMDVVALARENGIHYMNGPNTVTYFSILFW